MREIKFRAWDKTTLKPAGALELAPDAMRQSLELYQRAGGEVIWEQFTGLKDKNGKEIYEGDIVKTRDGYKDFVKYDGCMFGITFPHIALTHWAEGHGFESGIEVIGNIHENPDLLKSS